MTVPAGFRRYAADSSAYGIVVAAGTDPQPVFSAPGVLWAVSDRTGATVTNLYSDSSGNAMTSVTATDRGFVPFWAPGTYGGLWLQQIVGGTPTGAKTVVWPEDLADVVKDLQTVSGQAATKAYVDSAVAAAIEAVFADSRMIKAYTSVPADSVGVDGQVGLIYTVTP